MRPRDARTTPAGDWTRSGATLTRSGMVLGELERRLLLLRIDRAEGRANVRADAAALEKDARARGAGLVARRVQAL